MTAPLFHTRTSRDASPVAGTPPPDTGQAARKTADESFRRNAKRLRRLRKLARKNPASEVPPNQLRPHEDLSLLWAGHITGPR